MAGSDEGNARTAFKRPHWVTIPFEATRTALPIVAEQNLLATIIKEMVFDPDAGSIVVTLVDDADERIMTAKFDGSPTR